jgi:two-component system phosphate regulon sensor histidine kinase PhoR
MKAGRWRLRPALAAGTLLILGSALLLTERIGERLMRTRLSPALEPAAVAEALTAFRAGFLTLGLVVLAVGVALAVLAAATLAGDVRRMRSDTVALSRGETAAPVSRGRFVELHGLAAAIDLLAGEAARRLEAMRTDRDELALLLNSVNEGILQVAPTGRLLRANPAARQLLGLPEDIGNQPVATLVRNAELRSTIERAATGTPVPATEIALDDQRRLLVAARPIRVDTGEAPAGAAIAFTDLTQLRRLEGVRRDFVANVSHELKTPLTSIRGYAETLLSDDVPAAMRTRFLEVIASNAERLHGIVDDLLDLSRLESGAWRPQLEEIPALDLIRDVWQTFGDRAGRKRIAFEAGGGELRVVGDPGGLRQVLTNLYDNAIRHTPEGGRITARVYASAGPAGARTAGRTGPAPPGDRAGADAGWVTLEIRDTGTGIPHDALPRIFERFYRVDPARSRAEGGTGLGLSIVKHLVESMGGDVSAESELGKGTTLRVRLPAALGQGGRLRDPGVSGP